MFYDNFGSVIKKIIVEVEISSSVSRAGRPAHLLDRWSSHEEAAVQAQIGVAASSDRADLAMVAPVKVGPTHLPE